MLRTKLGIIVHLALHALSASQLLELKLLADPSRLSRLITGEIEQLGQLVSEVRGLEVFDVQSHASS